MTAAVASVRRLLEPAADPGRAQAMGAYMKGIAPYLGLTSPVRRSLTRDWIRSFDPGPDASHLLSAAHQLVHEREREFSYVAIDLVARHQRTLPDSSLAALRALTLSVPWWDTVDAWSATIGRVGLRHTSWDAQVLSWATDDTLWARRVVLVFQVGRKEAVDLDVLFTACLANLGDRDFFIRKAIGWGLRDAARSYPEQVRTFVAEHAHEMAPLSVREATKHV